MAILVNGSNEKIKLEQLKQLMKRIMTSFIQALTRGNYDLSIHKR